MNSLYYQKRLSRNIGDKFFTSLSVICALIAILPLIFLVTYILFKGGSQITPANPPGDDLDAGGINPALIGTLIITTIASIIAIPVGVGGGIYLAEYSKGGAFSRFIRFGVNVLAGVPSIIAGCRCIYLCLNRFNKDLIWKYVQWLGGRYGTFNIDVAYCD